MTGYNECENCCYYAYDDDSEEYSCTVALDEDEYYKLVNENHKCCPYFRSYDEYGIVKKQM